MSWIGFLALGTTHGYFNSVYKLKSLSLAKIMIFVLLITYSDLLVVFFLQKL